MVWEEWESAMAGCGLRTRAVRASIAEAGEQLRALLPFGKAALITDAGTDEQLTERVRASLRAYRPQCIFAEGEDASMPLFSLPDDVRAVVAVGPRSALAARFFCTLRGGFSLLIPLRPSAEELFAPAAPRPWAGYPLAEPDLILVDGEILQNAEEARAEAALAALCAAELESDARFTESEYDARGLHLAAARAAEADLSLPAGREDVLAASAIFCLEKRSLPPFGCERAARAAAGGAGGGAALLRAAVRVAVCRGAAASLLCARLRRARRARGAPVRGGRVRIFRQRARADGGAELSPRRTLSAGAAKAARLRPRPRRLCCPRLPARRRRPPRRGGAGGCFRGCF